MCPGTGDAAGNYLEFFKVLTRFKKARKASLKGVGIPRNTVISSEHLKE